MLYPMLMSQLNRISQIENIFKVFYSILLFLFNNAELLYIFTDG